MNDLIIYKNDYGFLEKEQLSLDMGETWNDTGKYRGKEVIETDSCKCGIHYQWVERGTICHYSDKCKLLILQQSEEGSCEGWTDVVPRVAKMGEVIEYDSLECGTVEWEIRYEQECNGYNLVERGYYWIKEPDSTEWIKMECPPIDEKIIEADSCGCGYSELGEWYDSDEYACGSEINNVATSKYRKQYRDRVCKDNILEEKVDERWVLFESQSCDCGYFYWGEWYNEGEYFCGSEIDRTETSKYLKIYRDKMCGDNVIEKKAETSYTLSEINSCDCGYTNYVWKAIRYECPTSGNSTNAPLLYEELTDTACSQGVKETRYTQPNTRRVNGDYTCEYDENTKHNTTKKTSIILEYYDVIEGDWKVTPCVENGIVDYTYEELSRDCGYYVRWREEGETCCGSLEGAINEPTYSCETYPYSLYAIEIEEVTYNYNDENPTYEPTGRVRYGNMIQLESESCGYVPTLTQWKLLCPDVTADNYQTPEDLDECVECHNQQNAPSLFAIEYEQESTDGGVTWKDTGKTRTEKLLKWKSKACGYNKDEFQTRVIEGTTYCDGTTLKGSTEIWVSSDNGNTWTLVQNSRKDNVVLEENSTQCQEGGA